MQRVSSRLVWFAAGALFAIGGSKFADSAKAAYLEREYAEEFQRTDEFVRAAVDCRSLQYSFERNPACRTAWELSTYEPAPSENAVKETVAARLHLFYNYSQWLEIQAGVSADDPSFWQEPIGIEFIEPENDPTIDDSRMD